MDVYKKTFFHAVGVGPLDLSAGIAFMQSEVNRDFPWISANILDSGSNLVFKEMIVTTIQNTDFVITALTGNRKNAIEGIEIKNWQEVVPDLLQKVKRNHSNPFIIFLSTLSNHENNALSMAHPEIHLIISGDSGKGNIAPLKKHNCLITQTSKQGKYQGLLKIQLGNERKWDDNNAKKLAKLQNKLGSVNWQLRRMVKKANENESKRQKYSVTIKRLTQEKEMLNAKISAIKITLEEEKVNGLSVDDFSYNFIALKKNMPDDIPTEQRLKQLSRDIRNLHKQKKSNPLLNTTDAGISMPVRLVGYNSCQECHELQMDYWKTTRHAKAFATLVVKEKNYDLNCLICHLTLDPAKTMAGGNSPQDLLSTKDDLQSVGCESCHSSGKKHITDPNRYSMIRVPGKNVCLTCHTEEHDDNFIYGVKLERISCPSTPTKSESLVTQ